MLSSDCNEQQLEWLFSRRAEKEFYFCFQKKIKIIPITLPVNPCGKNTLHQEIVLLNVCQLIYVCMSGKDALNTLVSPFRLISFWKLRVKMSPKGFLFCPLKSWLKNWRLLDWKLLVSVTVILVCETGGAFTCLSHTLQLDWCFWIHVRVNLTLMRYMFRFHTCKSWSKEITC